MYVHRSPSGWVVQAPAKVNLFFEVLAKRSDGYHEIETLVYPIDLFDTLHFEEDSSAEIKLGCENVSGAWGPRGVTFGDVPSGSENLAVRAAELLRRRAGVSAGASLRLVKRIPSAAGLGGGSSDAAAALVAANHAWRLGWSAAQLNHLASELGSDVPALVAGGPTVCRGRGEQVEPVVGLVALHLVVVRPPAGVATADVYRACRPATEPRRLAPLVDALVRGNLAAAGRLLFNRLEPAAKTLSPWIDRLQSEFEQLGCPGHQMSGSGTCYFGLCRGARHARRVARYLQARRLGVAWAVQGSR
jgi:4-diphosphocytidyl-2-C-methyl-D-erythritol kinase